MIGSQLVSNRLGGLGCKGLKYAGRGLDIENFAGSTPRSLEASGEPIWLWYLGPWEIQRIGDWWIGDWTIDWTR